MKESAPKSKGGELKKKATSMVTAGLALSLGTSSDLTPVDNSNAPVVPHSSSETGAEILPQQESFAPYINPVILSVGDAIQDTQGNFWLPLYAIDNPADTSKTLEEAKIWVVEDENPEVQARLMGVVRTHMAVINKGRLINGKPLDPSKLELAPPMIGPDKLDHNQIVKVKGEGKVKYRAVWYKYEGKTTA